MKVKVRISVVVVILMIMACDDIIEQDISKKIVALRAPLDGYTSSSAEQTFWWEGLDGSTKYRLTIASPSVDSANILILDTLITKTQFKATLPVGDCQWCVKAFNAQYETAYSCHAITIAN